MKNIFQNINPRNIDKILKMLEANHFTYKKGVTILSTITVSKFIAIINSGYVQIIKTDYNGNKTVIEELEEGDVFGSIIMPLNNPEYNIVTKEDTEITIIDYEHIMDDETCNSPAYWQFIKNLLNIIANRIEQNNQRVDILTNKTIRNKLLQYFKINSQKNKSRIIYLPYSFTTLADYLAIDRCAMSRELKYLKEEGFIEIKGKKITLLY